MVETSSLSQNEIDSMMKRIHSVPIIETLQMEILRLDEGECEGHVPRAKKWDCLLYTSPSPRDKRQSRMPSSA